MTGAFDPYLPGHPLYEWAPLPLEQVQSLGLALPQPHREEGRAGPRPTLMEATVCGGEMGVRGCD